MQFNENEIDQMSHGDVKNVERGVYKTKSGKLIEENKTMKDLGVLASRDVSFSEQIEDLVLTSKIKSGLLLKTFKTREVEPKLEMFNSFIYGKFSVRSPRKMEKVHHPNSDLSVIHYMGLFSPTKKLVKGKKLYSQNFSKYAPLKSDRGFRVLS